MTRVLRIPRVPEEDRERGLSLAEMLVAMAVLAILLTIVGGFLVSAVNVITVTAATSQATAGASNDMNELEAVIRSGTDNAVKNSATVPAFVAASAEGFTMYSFVNSYSSASSTVVRPQMVQFYLDATTRQLTEKRWVPSISGTYFTFPSSSTPATTTRTLPGKIEPTPTSGSNTNDLFTYFDGSGAKVIPTATNLGTIQSVRVTVRILGAKNSAHPNVVLVNNVDIPNLPAAGD
jgi:prepilin-type N-terminal cleavage/methylation domain-containing protein